MNTLQKNLSIGCFVSLVALGLDLVMNLSGARTVIEENLPILEFVLPIIGFGIIVIVSLAVVKFIKNQTIRELEDLITSGEELLAWGQEFQSQLQSQPQLSLRHQPTLRYCILLNKYRRWLRESKEHPSVGDSLRAAAECVETLRAYGYVRGRYRIWRARREWDKLTASARTND